jgi:hypothetical protein
VKGLKAVCSLPNNNNTQRLSYYTNAENDLHITENHQTAASKTSHTISLTSSGLCGVIAGCTFSLAATVASPSFSKFMSISAKTSFPVMAGLGLFTYGYEISMHDAMRCSLVE